MDHKPAFDYTDTAPEHLKTRIHTNEFTIGSISLGGDKIETNTKNSSVEEKQSIKKRNQNSQYEFIIHKIVQYNIRKYPDEIVSKNVVIHGKIFYDEIQFFFL